MNIFNYFNALFFLFSLNILSTLQAMEKEPLTQKHIPQLTTLTIQAFMKDIDDSNLDQKAELLQHKCPQEIQDLLVQEITKEHTLCAIHPLEDCLCKKALLAIISNQNSENFSIKATNFVRSATFAKLPVQVQFQFQKDIIDILKWKRGKEIAFLD